MNFKDYLLLPERVVRAAVGLSAGTVRARADSVLAGTSVVDCNALIALETVLQTAWRADELQAENAKLRKSAATFSTSWTIGIKPATSSASLD
jgi:hypothetical protein